MSTRRETVKKEASWIGKAIGAFIFVIIIKNLWPDIIPFRLFEFWKPINVIEVLSFSWPVFVWGGGFTLLVSFMRRNKPEVNRKAEYILAGGLVVSGFAGIAEEIAFRWLIFYEGIVGYKVVNWLFFGWAGFGVAEYIYVHAFGPLADVLTLGYLHPILFNGLGWAVGASVLSSTSEFRDGHQYLGLVGWINSWFVGMFMFYLMFKYGIVASILVHFMYDMLIFIAVYIDAAIERALGWT